jgi:hypothetical protein
MRHCFALSRVTNKSYIEATAAALERENVTVQVMAAAVAVQSEQQQHCAAHPSLGSLHIRDSGALGLQLCLHGLGQVAAHHQTPEVRNTIRLGSAYTQMCSALPGALPVAVHSTADSKTAAHWYLGTAGAPALRRQRA